VAAAATLAVAGYAHEVIGLTSALGSGVKLDSPTQTVGTLGSMNILIMGLESRTNFQGQNLSFKQLVETHSGNVQQVDEGLSGSQDTDTLILIHVFAGGQKAVGFSIPRDDVVNYPHATYDGLTEGKVDAAYWYAYLQQLNSTSGSNMSRQQRYLEANQAGQLFEIETVESMTGVHIDHFIESNIIGFYELADQFGGLEVCIKPAPAQGGLPYAANMTDKDPLTGTDNSGFDAYRDGYNAKKGGAQYLHLGPAQSLAYVRSRDTLPGVDIGRTARQQAAIEYIVWKLRTSSLLSDLGSITTMLGDARSYLMYDQGWDLVTVAEDIHALSGADLHFTTLPEISTNNVDIPGYPGLQSANFIDIPQIQEQVNEAFYGTSMIPSGASSVKVDVYNGSNTYNLAAEVSQDFTAMGYQAGAIADSSSQSQPLQSATQVFYGSGSAAETSAQMIANVMGVSNGATALSSLPAGQVEVLLGSQVTAQAPGLEMFGADSVNAGDYITAAQENNQSFPAGVQAAENTGVQTDPPAYSQKVSTPKPTPSPSTSTSSSSPTTKTGSKGKKPSGKKTSTTKPSGGTSSSNPPYGLTTCPY
jgi:anionic cell wall polymer biosynthesis LytR-Cps2A-Psr (LCP) family protein